MKIALLGDLGFFGRYSIENNSSVYEYFKEAADYLSQFDYVIGNLELPLLKGGDSIGAKSAYLKSDPANVQLLRHLNINIVTLANNHIFDFGLEGVESTINLLDQNNIQHFGLNDQDVILENDKVVLHGYCCYSTNPYGLSSVVDKLNIEKVSEKLKSYHQQGYLNIISVHAGLEHVNYPAYHDIQMARQFSKLCPYIYYGHHPHVLQGIEKYNNSLIAYSLGNFCFDDVYTDKSSAPLVKQSENNKSSAIVELEIIDGKLVSDKVTSLYMSENSLEINSFNIEKQLKKYTEFLTINKEEYNQNRNQLLSNYISQRKSMRDFEWYVKRLNFKSFIILFRAKYNSWRHKKNVLRHLNGSNE